MYNVIEEIGCSWLGHNLKFLYLHSNMISHIEHCLFTERMLALTQFSLGNNPLECCELRWLKYIISAADTLLDTSNTTCLVPPGNHFVEESLFESVYCSPTDRPVPGGNDGITTNTKYEVVDIVGAVFGSFFGLLLLQGGVASIFYMLRRRKRQKEGASSEVPSQPRSQQQRTSITRIKWSKHSYTYPQHMRICTTLSNLLK